MAAEILYTIDKGVNFDAITGPFAANEDILSAVCFAVNNSANRWLVARGAEAAPANPAEVGYSDDSGAAWTNVDVEAAGTRAAVDSGALYAIDKRHIWIVISGGYILFSDDGGETWTPQSEGTITTEDLRAVHFADAENGMAAGDAGKVLKTNDGGATWSEVTDILAVPNVLTVQMFDKNTAIVGTANGMIYMTLNGGTSWVQKYSISGGSVDSINVVNKFVVWAVSNTGGPVGTVIRSRNGGYSWELITTPTNTGLNSIKGLDSNKAWAVGNAGVIVKVSG